MKTVIIANAMEFADALAGVPLAYEKEAPILLAYGSKLRATTRAEVERLGAEEAVILGGEAAISQSIEQELKALGLSVKRISGDDRFETSALIADELEKTSPSNKAVVVDGMEFADAMSIAPFAAREGMPIYLTKTHGLSNADDLDDYNETYIVGGETAVSTTVEEALNSVTRLAGLDRYDTNREVLEHFGVEASELFVSTGLNFADALTGSVLAARNNSAVTLVKGDVHSKLLDQFGYSPFTRFTILGGEAAVSNRVKGSLNTYVESITEVVQEEKQENPTEYPIEEVENDNLPNGETNIVQEGKKGYELVTFEVTYVNGVETRRVEVDRTKVDPVKEITEIGTQVTDVIEEVVTENIVSYETLTQENNQLPEGETRILQEGTDGYDEVTYVLTYVNGEETNSIEVERTTIAPISEVKEIGTKKLLISEEVLIENYKWAETIYIEDDIILEGEEEIVEYGMEGYEVVTYKVSYYDDVEVGREEISREIIEPVNSVIKVGTLPDTEISFEDIVFEEEIRKIINKDEGPINISDVTHITDLRFYGSYINNLGGIEKFYNLENLLITNSNIDDISMFSSLTKLKSLNLNSNYISDISSLSSVTNLESLTINYNDITDISFLSNLTKLTYLSANNNNIIDITSLENLTEIEYLNLGDNSIESISSLSNMNVLERAYLGNNSITDLKPLENLDKLRAIYLYNNKISDITPLLSTTIRELSIQRNNLVEEQYLQLEEALGIRINR